jgi:hypothetical protein
MQRSIAPKRTRKSHHTRRPRLSPYLLDEIAFTRSDIERARTDTVSAA